MLVQAQASEAQAASGFWAGPGKKESIIAGTSCARAALAAEGLQQNRRGLRRAENIVLNTSADTVG